MDGVNRIDLNYMGHSNPGEYTTRSGRRKALLRSGHDNDDDQIKDARVIIMIGK